MYIKCKKCHFYFTWYLVLSLLGFELATSRIVFLGSMGQLNHLGKTKTGGFLFFFSFSLWRWNLYILYCHGENNCDTVRRIIQNAYYLRDIFFKSEINTPAVISKELVDTTVYSTGNFTFILFGYPLLPYPKSNPPVLKKGKSDENVQSFKSLTCYIEVFTRNFHPSQVRYNLHEINWIIPTKMAMKHCAKLIAHIGR
jgi:hypothetical protein